MKKLLLFAVSALRLGGLSGQAQDLVSSEWPAKWISVPETGALDYGVYYFRKDVNLPAVPAHYLVHVTGDNRYKLYVNETLVSMGPAKGDNTHWNYETVDLAPYLNGGRNVIAAPRTSITRWGYVFDHCTIRNDMSPFYLARGWHTTPRCRR